jgi:hypothetical protein
MAMPEFSPYVEPRRRRLNLVLITDPTMHLEENYERMAETIRQTAPDVVPLILPRERLSHRQRLKLALRPTMIFSPTRFTRPRFYRGARLQGRSLWKNQEYELLESAGVPIPKWRLLSEHEQPDLSDFGPYVVQKPALGYRGAEVKIKRRGRVRWKRPASHHGKLSDWIVQEFIYTGRWPISYRVTTLFGHVVLGWRAEADRSRRPLESREGFPGGDGHSIVSSHMGCTFTLQEDEEVLDLARRAARAVPDIPLLGVDVIRDAETGRLYVLELNPTGHVWHFATDAGIRIQEQFDLDTEGQFDGIRKAAVILLSETRRRAR